MRITIAAAVTILVLAGATAGSVTHHWPQGPLTTIGLMLEKYGKPDQYDGNSQVWFNNGQWKRTIIHRKSRNYLEQTIAYLVPHNRVERLKRFNPRISVSLTAGELTVASESEDHNRLTLNLAEEIVTGRRTVQDAQAALTVLLIICHGGLNCRNVMPLCFFYD